MDTQPENEIDALAHQIAYCAARGAIEQLCPKAGEASGWRITTLCQAHDDAFVSDALRYLALRRLLERHPSNHALVRVLPSNARPAATAVSTLEQAA